MTDTYNGGYKKALLDILNILDNQFLFKELKSKKQYDKRLKQLLQLLLNNPIALDSFKDGVCWFKIDKENNLISISYDKK